MENSTDKKTSITKDQSLLNTAIATAIIGSVFSLILLGMLFANYINTKYTALEWENRLAQMKLQMQDSPEDENLLSQIRWLDQQIRNERMRKLVLSRRAGFMLLGSSIIFLVGSLWASKILKTTHIPQPLPDQRIEQIKQAALARWSLVAGALTLVIAATILVIARPCNFSAIAESSKADANSEVVYPSYEEYSANWYRFRGPGGAGVTSYTDIPTVWDVNTNEGILWKKPVLLPGFNSPVIWGDRIFISGGNEENRRIYCYSLESGDLLWTGDIPAATNDNVDLHVYEDTGYAASTLVTDGERVYGIFTTGDIACFDYSGKRIWNKNLGTPKSNYNYATSLEMFQNLVLVQYDHGDIEDELSMLYAIDGLTGNIVYKTPRPVPGSWTSPIVIKAQQDYQLITVADPWVISYNPANGKSIWWAEYGGVDIAPSAIYAGGYVFAVLPHGHIAAIKPDGRDDVTETHLAWINDDSGPDICSPVSDGEYVYLLYSDGYIVCHDITDGNIVYEHEFNKFFYASPSIVNDKLYVLDYDGNMYIGTTGPKYQEIAKSQLKERCHASPAFAPGKMIIRTDENLYCIGRKEQ